MTPEFAGDGQICYARLYRRRISSDTNYLGNDLPVWELKDVLNQLVPPQTRGEKTNFFGTSFLLGQMAQTIYSYEKVTITFLTSLNFSSSQNKKAPSTKKEPEDTMKSDDMFSNSFVRDAEIVSVSWKDRKCANK